MSKVEQYYDSDGNPVSLNKLCDMEPDWAANVIRYHEEKMEALEAERDKYKDHYEDYPPADIQEVKSSRFRGDKLIIKQNKEIQSLQSQIKVMREGLEFYADKKNYQEFTITNLPSKEATNHHPINEDRGDKARTILQEN